MNIMTNIPARTAWEPHPIALIWPEPDAETYAAMKASIKAHGQKVPALLFQDKLLDGKTRAKICDELGIPLNVEVADVRTEDQALKLAITLNSERRHLSMEERAFVGARIANLQHGSNQFRREEGSIEPSSMHGTRTAEEAAGLMKVSKSSVKRAKVVIKEDKARGEGPKLEKAVIGKIKTLTATSAEITRTKEPKERKPQAGKLPKVTTFKSLKPEEVDPELWAKDPAAFTEKYGHVLTKTKEQLEARDERGALIDWRGAVRHAAEIAARLKAIPDAKARTEWVTRNEANRRLFETWQLHLQRLCESLHIEQP